MGHAYSAWLNARTAQLHHGRFLVRIEDIDTTRCTPQLMQHCLEDLAWLGLEWEVPVRFQSHHLPDYQAALARLRAQGLVYPCFCSRKEIAAASDAQDPDGAPLYPGTCRALPPHEVISRMNRGEAHSWRLNMHDALRICPPPYMYQVFALDTLASHRVSADPARWGDAILARKEIPTSYHLSVVLDDAAQGITHVLRGCDLEAATDLHVLLQMLLGLPSPHYHHHALLRDPCGEKLAKSKSSTSLAQWRAEGATPQEILGKIERWMQQ